jgi:hypothetical protein
MRSCEITSVFLTECRLSRSEPVRAAPDNRKTRRAPREAAAPKTLFNQMAFGGRMGPPHPSLSPLKGERAAKGWRGKPEPYPQLGEGVTDPIGICPDV